MIVRDRARLAAALSVAAASLVLSGCGSLRGERVMTSADGATVERPAVVPTTEPVPVDSVADVARPAAPVIEVSDGASIPTMFEFTSTLVDGGTITGADLIGAGPVVMTFVQPTCPISKEEAPKLAESARLNPDITYVVIHSGGSLDEYRTTIAEAGLDADNVVHIDDSDQSLWHRFAIEASPSSILVDEAGLVRSSYGALGDSGLERAATALHAGF